MLAVGLSWRQALPAIAIGEFVCRISHWRHLTHVVIRALYYRSCCNGRSRPLRVRLWCAHMRRLGEWNNWGQASRSGKSFCEMLSLYLTRVSSSLFSIVAHLVTGFRISQLSVGTSNFYALRFVRLMINARVVLAMFWFAIQT